MPCSKPDRAVFGSTKNDDSATSKGGLEKVCISKSLVQYARNANSVYKEHLENTEERKCGKAA